MTKIFIATPAYDGKVNVSYAVSLYNTCLELVSNDISFQTQINTSGSLLCAERNRLVEAFWKSDCTHMLCIDADLGWPKEAVLKMIEADEEFVAGIYPSRKEPVFIFRPKVNENGSIVVNVEKQLLEMDYIPGGFMLLKRSAIEKMRNANPDLFFEPKHEKCKDQKGYYFFRTELFEGEFWGEDYVFCRVARNSGVRIFVDPKIEFDHDGSRGMLLNVLTNERPKDQKELECKSS